MNHANRSNSRARAFTLIEMLITISVIVVLVAAVFGIGLQVVTRQKINQTNGVLSSLDRALQEYQLENRVFPRVDTENYLDSLWRNAAGGQSPVINQETGQTFLGGVANYRGEQFTWLPNAAYFLFLAEGYENIDSILGGIPSQFAATVQINTGVFRTQVTDAWDNPIIFVTPDNPLAQAIFGQCPSGRPYFMSAGPDGHYGVQTDQGTDGLSNDELRSKLAEYRKDNIYSVVPGEIDNSFNPTNLSSGQFR